MTKPNRLAQSYFLVSEIYYRKTSLVTCKGSVIKSLLELSSLLFCFRLKPLVTCKPLTTRNNWSLRIVIYYIRGKVLGYGNDLDFVLRKKMFQYFSCSLSTTICSVFVQKNAHFN